MLGRIWRFPEKPAESPSNLQAQKTNGQGQKLGLTVVDEKSAEFHDREAERGKRERPGNQSVGNINSLFAARDFGQRTPAQSQEPFDAGTEVTVGLAAQVRHAQQIAQKIIPIELEQWVEVQQGLETGGGQHCQSPV